MVFREDLEETRRIGDVLGASWHDEDFLALSPCARPHFGESGFYYDIRGYKAASVSAPAR
jgi:hypothetical protein